MADYPENPDHRWTVLDGLPAEDDPELTTLMEAVHRLPRDRADTVIESLLMCCLGFERTGNQEFMTRQATSALVGFRARRDPEDQKALDAAHLIPEPGPEEKGSDLDDMFRRLGLRESGQDATP